MSFLKKLLPFLFKEKGPEKSTATRTAGPGKPRTSTTAGGAKQKSSEDPESTESSPIVAYALIARSKNHRGLRKGSKVYIRQIFDDGERLRVRGTAPNGRKVTLTVNRRSLSDFESEGVPEHLAKHYSADSIFQDEHEAKVKAEVMGKR